MLPPYEIKAKDFTHVLRGYAVEEVDEYCAFALDKYTELYRENDALEQRIASLEAELAHFREDEESIRSALVDAKRASTRIVEEATERSKVILHSAKLNCDRILSEFRSAVSEERDELLLLRAMVKKFKDDLFATYKTHIEYIERIAPELDSLDESEFSDEAVLRLAVESIKGSIREDVSTTDGDVPLPTDGADASGAADGAVATAAADGDSAAGVAVPNGAATNGAANAETENATGGNAETADDAADACDDSTVTDEVGAVDAENIESDDIAADGAENIAYDDAAADGAELADNAAGADGGIPVIAAAASGTVDGATNGAVSGAADDIVSGAASGAADGSAGVSAGAAASNTADSTAAEQMSIFSDEDELILERGGLGGFDAESADDEEDDFLAFPEELTSHGDDTESDAIGDLLSDIRDDSNG